MQTKPVCSCFLLTHGYRDTGGHFEITLFACSKEGNPVKIVVDNFRPLFFVPRNTPQNLTTTASVRRELELLSLDGTPVDCLYFATYSQYMECARSLRESGIKSFESDIHPVERYLMERGVKGCLSLTGASRMLRGLEIFHNPHVRGCEEEIPIKVMSVDIETSADSGEVYSIACKGIDDKVFIVGDGPGNGSIIYCENESLMLKKFKEHLKSEDPDIIIGWNVVDFDLSVLQDRFAAYRIPFDLGRDAGARILRFPAEKIKSAARIPGRVVLDVPVMLRSQYRTFERYSLEFVASEMLGEHKSIKLTGREKTDEIDRLFMKDKAALAAYNLRDAELTKAVFDRAGILANAIEWSKNSGHLLDKTGGSVAAFDYLYLPRLHREGYVAPEVADAVQSGETISGGHVMESRPGIYENVLLLDFRSLYPTIILTFFIDPLGYAVLEPPLISGPAGPPFSRSRTILPKIIRELLTARMTAKQAGNRSLSQAIKILMNSFYGVLGSTGCRFFSPQLAGAITGTGRYLLKTVCEHIEQTTPYSVIYGDTDSLFVLLDKGLESKAEEIGSDLVAEINQWLAALLKNKFDADSSLELEFETHFRHFFMPTIRGSSQGSKKRYCGAVEKDGGLSLVFKGLESARSDWTDLAKEFQHELCLRAFLQKPVEQYVSDTVRKLKKGEYDGKLVYRKGLRKRPEEYTDHIPPHVQAAMMLKNPPSRIAYVVTLEGPQPIEKVSSPLDYDHYIETQLRPVADSILEWKGLDFETIISDQLDLFGGRTR